MATLNGEENSASVPKTIRNTPDWGEEAISGEHLWVVTSPSTEICYVGDSLCQRYGDRLKCGACSAIAHESCVNILYKATKFFCKPTFRDNGVRQYRENTSLSHHWVNKKTEKGKCLHCGKAFPSKLGFSCKDFAVVSCSWCKSAYHNKDSCLAKQESNNSCDLGAFKGIIVLPAWIVKLPKKGHFKSSFRRETKEAEAKTEVKDGFKDFVLKPNPTSKTKPVIVFINPKSGGNQGMKLLQKFYSILNPRQIFDLTQGGPKFGLELYRKVHNLRVLACGGDGTVGWVLSVIDQIGMNPAPAVGILPLGTGNDLARALGWGGGYTDEPITKILTNIDNSEVVLLDRWFLDVQTNQNSDGGKDNLPLNVVNNYFSLGVDAHIALEFHEAREAHPEKFNSRIKNKMFYGQMGGKDLLRRQWKALSDFVTIECDGKDLTATIKDNKFHAIVFLNIASYGGGTHPWNKSGFAPPSTDDGLIEVFGLTTYQLPLLQAGGHGTSITQCKSAKIVTTRTIPMQVDGEACKMAPCTITISHLNKVPMLVKKKFPRRGSTPARTPENFLVRVNVMTMSNYEDYHSNKSRLEDAGRVIGSLEINPLVDLEQLRKQLDEWFKVNGEDIMPQEWQFLDAYTAEKCFRIDPAQENLYYALDIASDNLYVLKWETQKSDTASLQEETTAEEDKIEMEQETKPEKDERCPRELLEAIKEGKLKKVKQYYNKLTAPLYQEDKVALTILHYALQYGDKNIIKYFLSICPNFNVINLKEENLGQTALHKATATRQRTVCCMLVALGADLGLKDNQGLTASSIALRNGDEELGNYLKSQEGFMIASR